MFDRSPVYSQAPKAVQAWKSDLSAKKRSKIATTIADPATNPEMFEEGWEDVLAREEALLGAWLISFMVFIPSVPVRADFRFDYRFG